MKVRFATLLVAALLVSLAAYASVATTPSASVKNVSAAPNPACGNSSSVTVSATITGAYDSNSGPTTVNSCQACRANNNYCGTGNSSVGSQNTQTVTTVTISNTGISASAGGNQLQLVDPNTNLWQGVVSTAGADGNHAVSVSATSSEQVTTSTRTTVSTYSDSKCTTLKFAGEPSSSSTTVTKTSSAATGSGSYVFDGVPGSIDLQSGSTHNTPPSFQQGGHESVQVRIANGSAGTPFSVSATATNADNPNIVLTGNDSASFNKFGPHSDGIAPGRNASFALQTSCTTPTGLYHLTVSAATQDLCGNPYAPLTATLSDFTITPGAQLGAASDVLSEFTDGTYGLNSCAVNSVNKAGKLNSTPGTVHAAASMAPSGPCLGVVTNAVLTVTIPNGYSFDTTGNSPIAHVFAGNANGAWDFHDGTPLVEVTTLPGLSIQQTSPNTVQISFANVDLGAGVGVVPDGFTLYARAHTIYSATSPSPADTPYVFSSTASATSSNIGLMFESKSTTVVGNPNASGSCNVDGVLVH